MLECLHTLKWASRGWRFCALIASAGSCYFCTLQVSLSGETLEDKKTVCHCAISRKAEKFPPFVMDVLPASVTFCMVNERRDLLALF